MIDAQKNIPDFSPLSWPDDYLMSRAQAEALSRAVGLPVAEQYLAKLHCVSSDGAADSERYAEEVEAEIHRPATSEY
jgi:hypothetical protein